MSKLAKILFMVFIGFTQMGHAIDSDQRDIMAAMAEDGKGGGVLAEINSVSLRGVLPYRDTAGEAVRNIANTQQIDLENLNMNVKMGYKAGNGSAMDMQGALVPANSSENLNGGNQ